MAIVAATTLGVGHFDRVRAAITTDQRLLGDDEGQGYRLIVQSYERSTLSSSGLPPEHARPLGSVQRAITAEELAAGVEVDIVQLGEESASGAAPVVVAWVEPGQPDLEFDARTARPARNAFLGFSPPNGEADTARVVLKRRAA